MEVAVGTYLRHQRYGLGRVVRWERGLFPRVHVRFEDGVDRTMELDPAQPVNAPPRDQSDHPSPAPRAGRALAPTHWGTSWGDGFRLVDGGNLERVPGFDAAAEPIVFTIGYEGRTIAEFVATLERHRVGLVADIREAPVSKRRGFGKAELEAALRDADIAYVLKRKWGNPKRKAGGIDERRDPPAAMTVYTTYMTPYIVQAAAFVQEVLAQRPAFLCYEAEPFHCHRSRFTTLVLPHCRPEPAVHHILPDAR